MECGCNIIKLILKSFGPVIKSNLSEVSYGYQIVMTIKVLKLGCANAYDHTTLNTPVLVRSLKLSSVGPAQYLDG